jgi:hypothetical protein
MRPNNRQVGNTANIQASVVNLHLAASGVKKSLSVKVNDRLSNPHEIKQMLRYMYCILAEKLLNKFATLS